MCWRNEQFRHVSNRDNYMVPFQCDLCHFHNITKHDPGLSPVAQSDPCGYKESHTKIHFSPGLDPL